MTAHVVQDLLNTGKTKTCCNAYVRAKEFQPRYQKQFGINQHKGIREELAKEQYGQNFQRFIAAGILQRKYVDGNCWITRQEMIAGEEKRH